MRSIRQQLYDFIRKEYRQGKDAGWIPSGELQRMVWRSRRGAPATAQNIGRRLRELEEAKAIAVKYVGGSAFYKWLPHYLKDFYRTSSERKENRPEQLFRKGVPTSPPQPRIEVRGGAPVYVVK